MSGLLSHPDRQLHEHVAQVREAAEAVWCSHSDALRTGRGMIADWLEQAVRYHDVGKGSAAFQEYIVAPEKYRGPKDRKSHSPLSTLVLLSQTRHDPGEWQQRLSTVAAVAGHHHGFYTWDELELIFEKTRTTEVLTEQLASLPWEAVNAATNLTLTRIGADSQPWIEVLDDLKDLEEKVGSLTVEAAVAFRLNTQLLLSVLLEADKAFLAIAPEHLDQYRQRCPAGLPLSMVDDFLTTKSPTPVDGVRRHARAEVLRNLSRAEDERLFTITLPTGTGKTMIAASWAFALREKLREDHHAPKVVIVLPYLSIIDQTQTEYRDLLQRRPDSVDGSVDAALFMPSHSLAERNLYPEMDDNSEDFFVDTWQSEIIVTTFDQFLFALLSPSARHQMRFHNLCDALVVMDEVQSLPCKLWHPVNAALTALTRMGNTRLLAMSATQPGFLPEAHELVGDPREFFGGFGRYCLKLHHHDRRPLQDFINEMVRRAIDWKGQRVLITLNTRASARALRDALEKEKVAPLHFLSADVTPRDRLQSLGEIKEGNPCVVVSTQCIEAGVDIDMDLVIRDFGPLDSILQVAGRCNRNNLKPRCPVEIYSLMGENGRAFAEMIYDAPLLQATRQVLEGCEEVNEEEILPLARSYFDKLRTERDTGEEVTQAWARWEETESVRELLRGKQSQQVTFVVIEQDPELTHSLQDVVAETDRWKRRRCLRSLAADLARVSVSVYARRGLDPSDYADRDATGLFWLLRPGYYREGRGLDFGAEAEETGWGIICFEPSR